MVGCSLLFTRSLELNGFAKTQAFQDTCPSPIPVLNLSSLSDTCACYAIIAEWTLREEVPCLWWSNLQCTIAPKLIAEQRVTKSSFRLAQHISIIQAYSSGLFCRAVGLRIATPNSTAAAVQSCYAEHPLIEHYFLSGLLEEVDAPRLVRSLTNLGKLVLSSIWAVSVGLVFGPLSVWIRLAFALP